MKTIFANLAFAAVKPHHKSQAAQSDWCDNLMHGLWSILKAIMSFMNAVFDGIANFIQWIHHWAGWPIVFGLLIIVVTLWVLFHGLHRFLRPKTYPWQVDTFLIFVVALLGVFTTTIGIILIVLGAHDAGGAYNWHLLDCTYLTVAAVICTMTTIGGVLRAHHGEGHTH